MKTSVHVSLDVDLAKRLDEYAASRRMTRSRAMEELIESCDLLARDQRIKHVPGGPGSYQKSPGVIERTEKHWEPVEE